MELLVVVVIIGLLAAFVAPRYVDQVGKSSAKIAKAQITSLEQALDQSLRAVRLRAEGSKAEGSKREAPTGRGRYAAGGSGRRVPSPERSCG
jgi:type II secretory pathway pseudopilin PulG